MRMLRYIQCPCNVFELLVQVFACPLHSLFFVLGPGHLSVSAAMEFLFKHSLHLNNCTVAQSVVCNTLIKPFSASSFANTES